MLQLLNFPPLSTRRNFLKLTTMYKIIGNFYFPPGVFVQQNFPYSTNQHTNFIVGHLLAHSTILVLIINFVPVVSLLCGMLYLILLSTHAPISEFKRLLHSVGRYIMFVFTLRLMYHISITAALCL